MPATGVNAQTLLTRCRLELEKKFGGGTSDHYTETYLFGFLDEAYQDLQAKMKLMRNVSGTGDLVSTAGAYAVPADMQGQQMRAVSVMSSASATQFGRPLDYIEYDKALRLYGLKDSTPATGAPIRWCFNSENARQVFLLPHPNYAKTDGLLFSYTRVATPMRLLWNPSSITATATKDSPTIALSGAIETGLCAVGHEFGIRLTTQSDGAAAGTTEPPQTWFSISALDTGADEITLSEDWPYPTETSKAFITAEVPDLELAFPGRLGFAPSLLAAGTIRELEKEGAGAVLIGRALGKVADVRRIDSGMDLPSREAARTSPFLRR